MQQFWQFYQNDEQRAAATALLAIVNSLCRLLQHFIMILSHYDAPLGVDVCEKPGAFAGREASCCKSDQSISLFQSEILTLLSQHFLLALVFICLFLIQYEMNSVQCRKFSLCC